MRKKGVNMSNVKCEVCGRPITHCPACFSKVPSFAQSIEETDFKFPTIPVIEVELPSAENGNNATWTYNTALPTAKKKIQTIEPYETGLGAFVGDFSDCSTVPVQSSDGSDMNLNPHIHRASISVVAPKQNLPTNNPYANGTVTGSYGDYNVEELTKIAVEQQFRAEKRKKRRMWFVRKICLVVIFAIIIVCNWDFFYRIAYSFIHGIDAFFQILALLG